jgi:hypothetical protein
METIIRDVKSIEPGERRVYESVVGHALQENQRVLVVVLDPGAETDESLRQKAIAELHDLCREGTECRQRLGVSVEEADQALEEALRPVRSGKTD